MKMLSKQRDLAVELDQEDQFVHRGLQNSPHFAIRHELLEGGGNVGIIQNNLSHLFLSVRPFPSCFQFLPQRSEIGFRSVLNDPLESVGQVLLHPKQDGFPFGDPHVLRHLEPELERGRQQTLSALKGPLA